MRLDRRELYNGFGNTLAKAVELVVTPMIFALGGHLLDARAGTRPMFTLTLLVFALMGMFARMYFAYVAEMSAHEARAPWKRRSPADDESR